MSLRDKRRFYEIAHGSATECGAVLDVMLIRGVGDRRTIVESRGILVRVAQMLSRLCGPPR